jgi:hypothetical protein
MYFILYHQSIKVYRFCLIDGKLKNPCTIIVYNLNTTYEYHFLARNQTGCYINYSN